MAAKGLPKVAEYVKNVGKSIVFASVDAVKANTSGIADFVDYNEDIFKEAYASMRSYRSSLANTEKSIKQSNLFQAIDAGLKNMIEDAKTGNFYNSARADDVAGSALGLDDDFDFDFDSDDDSFGEESPSAVQTLSDNFNQAIETAATSQNSTVAKGTSLIVNANKASTKLVINQMDRMTAHLSSSMGAVYTAIDKTNQFLSGPVLTHIENSKKYYETATSILQEQQLMMKEMLEMQRNLYKAQSDPPKSSKLNESMRFDGSMDIRGYMKNIKSNISDFADSMGMSMFNMDMGGGNPFMLYAAAPFKMVLEPLMQRLMSGDFKKALKSFDKGVTSMFSQAVARMNTARDKDDGSLLSIIGKIFGITVEKKETINTANYKKDAVPFDGITRQAIIEVIPGYLSRIEAALNGSGERHYDFKSGSWKSAKQIQKEFEDAKKSNIANANYDIRADLSSLMSELRSRDAKYEEQLSRSVDSMMTRIYKDGGDFRPQMGKGRDIGGTPAWKYYGFASEKDFDMVLKRLSKNTVRNIAASNMEAQQAFARRMTEEETSGGIFRHLFSGAYNNSGTGGGSHNPSDFVGGTGLLSASKDQDGHNVFWYLREILKSISNRNGGRRKNNRSNGTRTSPSGPSSSGGGRARESETSSTESEGDSSTDDSIPWDDIEAERAARDAEASENKKFGTWLQSKLEKTAIGKYFSGALGAVGNILSKPMEYATKLLNKADESMFQMMFGDKEFKDDDGKPIENVFSYIMYKVKKSFSDLTNWVKTNILDKIKNVLKPYWDKFGKPVIDQVKGMAKAGFNRAKEGLDNTFGRGFRFISEKLKRGDVVGADEVENASTSAGGRFVTKRGLTMISPGEIIIPASFDKREQQRMLALEKRDKNRIINAMYNAAGTVDTEALKKRLTDILNENKDNGAKIGASGILGAGAGLLTGVNPLLGALAGAGLSILSSSETLKTAIFGEEVVNKDGTTERKGGLIPKKVYDIFSKALPDMGDFGIAGGLVGLFTPFGPLGGAAIGAGIGFLKNSEGFKKFIFGDAETDKDGFINKETYDKIASTIKKAAPRIGIGAGAGAIGGLLGGPFGLLGGAAVGAGIGLLSSTETFHKFIFGDDEDENNNGLAGAFNNGIIQPAKEKILEFAANFKEYAMKNILEPMKNFWDPFQQAIKNVVTSTADKIKDHINDMFERTVGIPLHDFLQEKLFKPITKILFGILKAPIAVGKAIVSAPFKALGGIGNSIRMGQIQRGTAYDMSASERLAFRDKHKFRTSLGVASGKDKTLEQDLLFAGLSEEQLQTIFSTASAGVKSEAALQKELGAAREGAGRTVSDFFNTKSGGKSLYDAIQKDGGYNAVKKIAKMAADGDLDGAIAAINKLKGLSDAQKKDLIDRLSSKAKEAEAAAQALEKNRSTAGELSKELSDLVGHKIRGRKDMRRIYRNAEAELKARRKQEPVSEEQAAIDNFNEANKARTEKIISNIKDIHDLLEGWIHPKKDETTPPGDVKSNKEKDSKIDDSDTPSSEASRGTSQVAAKKDGKSKTHIDPVTGLPATVDEDSKEYKEAKAEREAEKETEKENLAQNQQSTTILGKLYENMFGSKNDKDKKGLFGKGGFIGSLTSGLGSFLKFMGVGGKIALAVTGVSLFGYASEWFKTSVWPTIKTALFGTTNEDGTTTNGLFGNIKDSLIGENGLFGKFTRWLDTKFTALREWYEGSGGISGILINNVLPKLITGWGYAVDNVVAPLTALLIKSLPSIAIGLVKGVIQGIKMAVFNKTLSRDSTVNIDTSSAQKEIADLSSKNSSSFTSAMGELGTSLKNVFGTAKSSAAYTADNASTIDINGLFGDVEEGKNNQKTTLGDQIFGSTHRTNEIEYDENGNIITNYTQYNKTDSTLSRVADSTARSFTRGLAGDVATGAAKVLGKASTKGIGGGVLKAATAGVGVVSKASSAVISGASKLGSAINTAANAAGSAATSSAGGNILVKGLTKIFNNIANSKIGGIIVSSIKKVTGKEITTKILDSTLKKLAAKLAEAGAKTAGKAVSSIATAVAGFSPLALALMVTDFIYGYDNANTILGVAAGDPEYEIGFGQKCLCGLLNLVNNRITLGLIPTSTIVDIIVEFLFPLFGLDATSLKEAQGRASAILDEWNKANPDETYDNLEDFNNKDKWWFKAWNGIKDVGSNVIGAIKTGASNAFNVVKSGASTAWEAVKTGVSSAIAGVKDFGENAKDVITPYIESIKGIPSLIASIVKDSINYAKTDEHSETITISKDDPLGGFKNVIKNITRVIMFPVAAVTKLFTMAKENVIDPIVEAAKNFGSTIGDGIAKVAAAAWDGDIIGAFTAQPDVKDDTGIIGNIAKVVFNVIKVPLSPVILIGGVIGTIKNGITSFIDAAKQVIPVVKTGITNNITRAWNPDSSNIEQEELQSTGNNVLDGVAGVVYAIAKVFTTPIVLVGKGVNIIKSGFSNFINGAKQVIPAVATAVSNRVANAWNPPAEGEEAANEEITSTGNSTLDTIANVACAIAKVFTTPIVLVGKGVNIIKSGFTAFTTAAGSVVSVIGESINNMMTLADEGDLSGITEGIVESTGNNTLDIVANTVFGLSKVFMAPVALVRAGIGVVKEGISKIIDGYEVSQTTKEADDAKIQNALNGDLSVFSSEYWTNADHSSEGLFGVIANIQTYIEKIFNAPVIIVKSIGKKIVDAFTGIKDWFGDTFGGIWNWITGFFGGGDRAEAVAELESYQNSNAASGRGKKTRYGLGHSYQTDPSISNIKYGDSTIGEAGCAPVAAANVLNNMGYTSNANTVKEAARYAEERNLTVPGGGTNIKYFNSYFRSKGINTSNTSNKDNVINALNNGNQVIMLGRDESNSPGAPYGTNPHFITAVGVDSSGNIIAEDPYYPQETITYDKKRALNSMMTSVIVDGTSMGAGKNRRRKRNYGGSRPKSTRARKGMGKIIFGLGGSLGPAAIINVAKSQVGITEIPTNQVKYNHAYYGTNVNGSAYPWCCAFVWWVFNQAGAADLFYGGNKTAHCPTLKSYYDSHGQAVTDPEPGDIVYFNWDNGTRAQHVGIVVELSGDKVITIEGNTGADNANGGGVLQRSRNKSEIVGYSRPNYPYTYDDSKVVDMSRYGDTTDYKAIAMNGGEMTGSSSSSSSTSSSTSSTSNTLLTQFTDLGSSMVKAIFGEDAYNALFGTAPSDNGTTTPGTDPEHAKTVELAGSTNSEKIWNYLKSKGFTDNGAAGIMGCWQNESSNRPDRIEGDYLSSFPGFDNVLKNSSTLNDYTTNTLFPAYTRSGISINEDGYKGTDGNYYPGIGLAQWTGPRGYQLFNYAQTNNKDWKKLETQLEFFNSELTDSFKNKLNSATTPQEAAHTVLDGYEMYEGFGESNPTYLTRRQNSASNIYNQFVGGGRAPSGGGRAASAMRKAYSKKYSAQSGGAARALRSNNVYVGRGSNVVTATTGVDYQTFLQTIVSILMNISDNTALLTKILEVLSQNFNINIDKSDIDAASAKTKQQTEAALNDLVRRSSGNNVNVSKLLNNKDTQYILSAMQAIASE